MRFLVSFCACVLLGASALPADDFFDIGDYDVDIGDDDTVTIVKEDDDGGLVVRHVQIASGFDKVEASDLEVNVGKGIDTIDGLNLQVVVGASNRADLTTTMKVPGSIESIELENWQLVAGVMNEASSKNDVMLGNVKKSIDAAKNKYKQNVGD